MVITHIIRSFTGKCVRRPIVPSRNLAAMLDRTRAIVVGDLNIHVYNFDARSDHSAATITLELSPPRARWRIASVSVTTRTSSPNTTFCRFDPRKEVYVICIVGSIEFGAPIQVLIFVPRDVVLACAELVDSGQHGPHFRWEEWASRLQVVERSFCFHGPEFGMSGSRVVMARMSQADELELEFLEHDMELEDNPGPAQHRGERFGVKATGDGGGDTVCPGLVSTRLKTRIARIRLPEPARQVGFVYLWENGIVLQTAVGLPHRSHSGARADAHCLQANKKSTFVVSLTE